MRQTMDLVCANLAAGSTWTSGQSEIPFLHSLCHFLSLRSFHCTVEALEFSWWCGLISAFKLSSYFCLCKWDKVVFLFSEIVRMDFPLPPILRLVLSNLLCLTIQLWPLGKKVKFLSVCLFFLNCWVFILLQRYYFLIHYH